MVSAGGAARTPQKKTKLADKETPEKLDVSSGVPGGSIASRSAVLASAIGGDTEDKDEEEML